MQTVTVSRAITASVDEVREAMADVEQFMAAGGFTEVAANDDEIYLRQNVGLGQIELHLDIVAVDDTELAYEQREGIFNEMRTWYELERLESDTRIVATTEFELGGVTGSVLDATVVKRKRRSELNAQFDYLEDEVTVG